MLPVYDDQSSQLIHIWRASWDLRLSGLKLGQENWDKLETLGPFYFLSCDLENNL